MTFHVLDLASGRKEGAANGQCKFLMVEKNEKMHLIHGPLDVFPYHASLLAAFCRRFEVASTWERRPDFYQIHDKNTRVRGGGYLTFEPGRKVVRAWGSSTAYGPFDRAILARLASGSGVIGGFRLVLE